MLKLKRLKIHRYRNVKPGCELIFNERRNILLGPNGSGKTTLLQFVSKILRSSMYDRGDPFEIEYECTIQDGNLRVKISTTAETPAAAGLAELGLQTRGLALPAFELHVNLYNPQERLRIWRNDDKVLMQREGSTEQEIARIAEYVTPPYLHLIAESVYRATSAIGRGIKLLGDLINVFRFDESLDIFRSLTARTNTEDGSERIRPQVVILEEKSNMYVGLFPLSLLQAILDQASAGISEDIVIPHEQLEFLSGTVNVLGLRSAEAKIELLQKSIHPGAQIRTFGNLRFFFTRPDGSQFQDPLLSYGQKRLLTFLYYLAANSDFVVADELVNGMHHAWIDHCLDQIGDRQAFLTSQNPLLLDHLWFESIEQVRSSFIICRSEIVDGREQLVWRNFTEDEADMFYRAYQVGIEHVGEILRTRGLW